MNKKVKQLLTILTILLVFTMPALAQRGGGGSSSGSSSASAAPSLTIQCNIRGASVEILDPSFKNALLKSGTAPFTVQLNRGNYNVRVSAPGYESKEESVYLDSSKTLNFNLGATKAALQVRTNVRDAKVIITGGSLSGQLVGSAPFTAQLAHGYYTVTVSAPGFLTTAQDINLGGSQTLNFNLEQESYNLTVTSNVPGAKVFIKGGSINGQLTGTTDMTTVLPPGQYRIKVNAPHYYAEEQTINFNQSATVNIQLRSRTGKLEVIIPNNILDYSKSNPAGRIKIYDNGTEIDGTSMTLTPGQHTIRITSGGFASQQTVNVREGESYRIELNFGFSLIKQ